MRKLLIAIIGVTIAVLSQAHKPSEDFLQKIQGLNDKAEKGDAGALYELARLYDIGFEDIPIDSAKSSILYRRAAEMGYNPARNYLGFRYYKGEFLKQNTDSALYWIRLAAENGDITAAANLAYLLTEGEPEIKDEEEALKWLQKAAEAGIMQPQIKYSGIMEQRWQQLPPDSLVTKGINYYIGKAPIVGIVMINIAAEKGSSKALAILGDAYSKGRGVPYDNSKALEYFHEAAIAGNPSAQFIIAELLEFFPDILETYPAVYWYEKAAEEGVTDSERAYQLLFSYP